MHQAEEKPRKITPNRACLCQDLWSHQLVRNCLLPDNPTFYHPRYHRQPRQYEARPPDNK
jgi:hypothetical protein